MKLAIIAVFYLIMSLIAISILCFLNPSYTTANGIGANKKMKSNKYVIKNKQ